MIVMIASSSSYYRRKAYSTPMAMSIYVNVLMFSALGKFKSVGMKVSSISLEKSGLGISIREER